MTNTLQRLVCAVLRIPAPLAESPAMTSDHQTDSETAARLLKQEQERIRLQLQSADVEVRHAELTLEAHGFRAKPRIKGIELNPR